jgi:phage antirepressor YoqD-like protein
MSNLAIIQNQSTIKSTELVDIINEFRKGEGTITELQHKDFMVKIRKELETLKNLHLEGERNFSLTSYIDSQNRTKPCFELNRDSMLQMLNSESTYVRFKTIEYINKLEEKIVQPKDLEQLFLNPDTIIKLATNWKEERTKRLEAENQIQKDKPKVIFAEALEVSDNTILIGELAKLLKQNGVNTGQNRLFETLRSEGYLIKRKGEDYNLPTQMAMELELFEIKVRTINNPDGSIRTTKTTKVTGKGQIYFINRFKCGTAIEEIAAVK